MSPYAADYLCESCLFRARVPQPPPSRQLQATRVNEVLGASVAHVKTDVAPYQVPVSQHVRPCLSPLVVPYNGR